MYGGGGKKVGRVMKKLEIDRGGITAFLVDQAGGVHDFFLSIHYRLNLFACKM
jgi:hypothetical protein